MAVPTPSFAEALRFWIKLGWISFGGPAGQIAIMHKELVEKRRWLSEEHFLHALNFSMLLPGPEAQQLATYLGWRLHGARGGIAAGALFVLPSALILFGLSWLYLAGGEVTWIQGIFYGLVPAVIAIVFSAVKRIGGKALHTAAQWTLALAAFVAIYFFKVPFVLIIATAALTGFLGGRFLPRQFPGGRGHTATAGGGEHASLPPAPLASWTRVARVSTLCLTLWWLPVLACGLLGGWQGVHFQQGVFFSKAALITFGGAYAVLPYVAQMAVERYAWLGQGQMIAGLGLAESTPGPLIMVLQFVGFVGGWQQAGNLPPLLSAAIGAGITTWVTFMPCFLFVFLGGPHVEGLRNRPALAATLAAITAAVVGVILNLAIWFTQHALLPAGGGFDLFVATVAIGALVAIERFRIGLLPVLGTCATLGVIARMVG